MTDQANATGAVMASVAWGFSFSLVETLAAIARLDDNSDPRTARMKLNEFSDRRETLEKRASEVAEIVGWATGFCTEDFVPKGTDVVRRAEDSDPSASFDEAKVEEVAKAMGMRVKDVEAAAEADAKERAREQAMQRQAITNHRREVTHTLQTAIDGHCSPEFDLSDRDAMRILEKLAEKCEKHEANRATQGLRTRRRKRLAQLGAERKLLEEAMNAADEALDRISDAEESKAEEAMADHRVLA